MNECIGISEMTFKTKDGNQIHGWKIYFTYVDTRCRGLACDSVFLSDRKFPTCPVDVGSSFELTYNKFGKVQGIQ